MRYEVHLVNETSWDGTILTISAQVTEELYKAWLAQGKILVPIEENPNA